MGVPVPRSDRRNLTAIICPKCGVGPGGTHTCSPDDLMQDVKRAAYDAKVREMEVRGSAPGNKADTETR